jgi:sporulation protein YlmC with PRC-barrel domain
LLFHVRSQTQLAHKEFKMLTKIALAAAIAATLTGFAQAQQSQTTGAAPSAQQATTLPSLPPEASTVTNWYRQDVYDPSEKKIGEITDVLVDTDGKIGAFIVSVGGFLGVREKHVAVPFNAVHGTRKDGKWWLTMNATKDALKSAPGYKYDRTKTTWDPA